MTSLLSALSLIVLTGNLALPVSAKAHIQCAPYARQISGIELHGAARLWWGEAGDHYDRGQKPKIGSVLAFRATHAMPSGHVAVVHAVIDSRHVLLNHANWSRPGMVEHAALAEDVSSSGDWSKVRVWYAPIGALGLRASAAYGFIYPHHAAPHHGATDDVADAGDVARNTDATSYKAVVGG